MNVIHGFIVIECAKDQNDKFIVGRIKNIESKIAPNDSVLYSKLTVQCGAKYRGVGSRARCQPKELRNSGTRRREKCQVVRVEAVDKERRDQHRLYLRWRPLHVACSLTNCEWGL